MSSPNVYYFSSASVKSLNILRDHIRTNGMSDILDVTSIGNVISIVFSQPLTQSDRYKVQGLLESYNEDDYVEFGDMDTIVLPPHNMDVSVCVCWTKICEWFFKGSYKQSHCDLVLHVSFSPAQISNTFSVRVCDVEKNNILTHATYNKQQTLLQSYLKINVPSTYMPPKPALLELQVKCTSLCDVLTIHSCHVIAD